MSSKDKDKKKKTTKLEKKETKILNPPELESSQLIARVTSRIGDKETKNIANNEDDPYIQTYSSSNTNTNGGAQVNNFSDIQNQYQQSNNHQRIEDYNRNNFQLEQKQEFYGQWNQNPYYSQQIKSTNNNDQIYKQYQRFALQDQKDYRYEQIRNEVNLSLLPKRQEILYLIQKIENRIEDIKYQTQQIENMTREECELMIDRLKSAEVQKLQRLYYDKDELLRNIEQIDDFYTRIINNREYVATINFNIFESIDRLTSIKIKNQIDLYSNDLPQEMIQLKQTQKQNIMLQQLIQFKNECIWKLLNDSKIESQKIKEEFLQQANQEFQEWSNIVDQQQQELDQYKLQCIFCRIKFDHQNINSKCNLNIKDAKLQFECEDIPLEEFIGTQRHFFSKSKVQQQS